MKGGRSARERIVASLPWLVLAALAAYQFAFVATFGRGVPYWDDFSVIPCLLGKNPSPLQWVFEPKSGHFAPLHKGAYYLGLVANGRSFVMFPLLTTALSVAAAVLALIAIRARRPPIEFDVLVPLALMNPGLASCSLRAILFNGGMHLLLIAWILLVVSQNPTGHGTRVRPAIVFLALALSMASGSGLVLAWFLLFALLAESLGWVSRWSGVPAADPGARRGLVPVLAGIAILAFASVKSLGGDGQAPASSGPARMAAVALQSLGQSFGPVGAAGWTESGYGGFAVPVFSLIALALVLAPLALVHRARARLAGQGTLAAAILPALLAGHLGLAAVIGVTRAGLGPRFGLQVHYGMFSAFLLVASYSCLIAALGRRWARLAGFLLLGSVLAPLSFNAQVGWRHGTGFASVVDSFSSDARAGMPVEELANRHSPAMYPFPGALAEFVRLMKAAKQRPFDR